VHRYPCEGRAMLGNACQRVLRAVFVFFLVGELIASMFVVLGLHYVDFLLVIPLRIMNPR
jgi:hypothetical protein